MTKLGFVTLQMVHRGHVVVDRLLQLRRPPGDLLRFPAARKADAPRHGAIGLAGIEFRADLRPGWTLRRRGGGSGSPQASHSRWIVHLERHLRGYGMVAEFHATAGLPRRRRFRRSFLLSRI